MKRLFAFNVLGKTCLVIALFISSCTKRNDPAPATCKPLLVDHSTGASFQYEYDSGERLVKFFLTHEGKDRGSVTYEYNQKGQVSKRTIKQYTYGIDWLVMAEVVSTHTFQYNDKSQVQHSTLTVASNNPAVGSGTYHYTCEYDTQGNRTKITKTGDGEAQRVDLFEYKDGNCIKATYRAGAPDESVTVFRYLHDRESKIQHEEYTREIFGPTPSKHALDSSTTTFKNFPGETVERVYAVQFNAQGFPIKIVHTTTTTYSSMDIIIKESVTSDYSYRCR